jgi:elongation factor Ts
MMECESAEKPAGYCKSEELLRIKSGAKASKAAGRVASEGAIGAYLPPDAKLGAMVEVNTETDFVALNPDFVAFAGSLAELVARENPKDVESLSQLKLGADTVEDARQKLVQKIGENIAVRHSARTVRRQGREVHHPAGQDRVLVGRGRRRGGKDVAMHRVRQAEVLPGIYLGTGGRTRILGARERIRKARSDHRQDG